MDCLRYAKVARHTKKPHRTKKNFIWPTMALHHPTSPLPSSPATAPHPLSATSIMALTSSAGRSSSSSLLLMRSNKSRRRHCLVLQRRRWRTGREPGHDGPCCSVGLLPTIINNDNLFYLSLAATLLPLPLRIHCRSTCRRRANAVAALTSASADAAPPLPLRCHCRRRRRCAAVLRPPPPSH